MTSLPFMKKNDDGEGDNMVDPRTKCYFSFACFVFLIAICINPTDYRLKFTGCLFANRVRCRNFPSSPSPQEPHSHRTVPTLIFVPQHP